MNRLILLSLLAASPTVLALEASCEAFVAAAEKSAQRDARHAVSDLGGGLRTEVIVVGGKSYLKADRGWQVMPTDLLAHERRLNAEMRSGKMPVRDCQRLGSETVDGIATTIVRYTIAMPGAPVATARAFIGADGLIHALSADDTRVRYRYTGVTAPALK